MSRSWTAMTVYCRVSSSGMALLWPRIRARTSVTAIVTTLINLVSGAGTIAARNPQAMFAYIARGRKGILRSMVAKYDLVKAAGFLDENHYHYDGFILTLRLAKLTPFVYLPDPLMEKREHAGGTSKGISFSEKERCFQDVLAEVMRIAVDLPEKDKRAISKEWFAKISELYFKAKMEEGDWLGAWKEIARRVVSDPRRLKASLKMVRDILSRAGRTS